MKTTLPGRLTLLLPRRLNRRQDLAIPGRPDYPVNGLLRDQMTVRHEKHVARALQKIWCTLCSFIGLNPFVWVLGQVQTVGLLFTLPDSYEMLSMVVVAPTVSVNEVGLSTPFDASASTALPTVTGSKKNSCVDVPGSEAVIVQSYEVGSRHDWAIADLDSLLTVTAYDPDGSGRMALNHWEYIT